MHRRGAVEGGLAVAGDELAPIPIDARQRRALRRLQRLLAGAGEGHAGRQHQALLRAADDDIDLPFVHAEIHRAQGRDGIDHVEGRVPGGVDRAAYLGDAVGDAGRGLVVDLHHRLDRVLLVLAQPRLDRSGIDAGAPVARQRLDLDSELLRVLAPVEREIAGLRHQHLVAGREDVDDRRLPGAMAVAGIGDDRLVGLEDLAQSGIALLGDGAELGAHEVEGRAVYRPQDAVRNVGRSGVLEELTSARDGHG